MKIKIGLADDQQLFLKALGTLVNSFAGFEVTVDALNGEELLRKLGLLGEKPDIVVVDVEMPVMNGVETVREMVQRYPAIKLVALSMQDDDATVIQMIRAGCCAYLLKDIHPDELERALEEIHVRGYYNADAYNINYRRLISFQEKESAIRLSENEKTFLQLASSDLTYKQVAAQMNLSERTIDGYRESLFEKLSVQSRVGMVLEGIRRRIITL